MKQKVIITGGNGYIGSILAANICKKYLVYILDKSKKNFFLKKKKINFIKVNLLNYKKTFSFLKKIRPDIIIHLAAQSTIDLVIKKKKDYLSNNILATKNIVEISKLLKIKKFIFSSTASVYKKKKILNETDFLKPNNLYGLTKLSNEKFIKNKFLNSDIKFCILRFFNVCGADKKNKIGEFHDPETHLLPIIIYKIYKKKKIFIYGNKYKTNDGTCIRDYIHIKDVVLGIIKSLNYLNNHKSAIFNLGTGRGYSVLELIRHCEKKLKMKSNYKFKKKRFGDYEKLICSYAKIKKKINWTPKYSSINRIINDEIWWYKFLQYKKIKRKFIY